MTANLQLKGAKGTCLSGKISSNLRPTKVEASPRPAKGSFGCPKPPRDDPERGGAEARPCAEAGLCAHCRPTPSKSPGRTASLSRTITIANPQRSADGTA